MLLDSVSIENVRSVEKATLAFSTGFNFVVGQNGSGKSSILEALHILSLGRSFRTRKMNTVLRSGASELRVVGRGLMQERSIHLGVEYCKDGMSYRMNREAVRSSYPLSEVLPLVVFSPETTTAFMTSSTARRAYIDWGCFQFDSGFIHHWKNYHRALKQRNALLRSRASLATIRGWDVSLSDCAERLNESRRTYSSWISNEFAATCNALGLEGTASVEFSRGWSTRPLFEDLQASIATDAKRLFTFYGCHRDDLKFYLDGRPLVQYGSRGQQKLYSLALKLLQVKSVVDASKKSVTVLLDDLAAEFDRVRQAAALDYLTGLEVQVVVTGLDDQLSQQTGSARSVNMFHVKQGAVESFAL